MSRGRKWYKKDIYDKPLEPFNPGDGSLVECVPDPDDAHPTCLKITRIWPDERVTVVRRVPSSQFSHALVISVENDIERIEPSPQQRENMKYFNETIGTKHYRPPYTVTSIVPGQKPGETFDPGTGKHYGSRAEFSQFYKENGLEQVGPHDIGNMKLQQTEGHGGEVDNSARGWRGTRTFMDPSGAIPTPKGFEGVKFYSSS